MTRFSFLIPTRARSDGLRRLFQSILDTSHRPDDLEIVLGIDDDDNESLGVTHPSLHLQKTIVRPGLTMGALNRACFAASSGRYVALMNDDVILRTKNWDIAVGAAFARFEDDIGLVHVNDLLFRERLCTFPFLARRACLEIGVCPEDYRRYRIDDHIYDTYNLLAFLGHQRVTYLDDVVFEHQNYEEDKGQTGQIFRSKNNQLYVPDRQLIEADAGLFDRLFDQRKIDAANLVRVIVAARAERAQSAAHLAMGALKDSYSYRRPDFVSRPRSRTERSPETVTTTVAVVTADLFSPHARDCVSRLKQHTTRFDLLVLDNNRSPDFNHPTRMNQALRTASTDFLVLMDDDVLVEDGWLEGLLSSLDDDTGVVAPLHRDKTGRISFSGVYFMGDRFGTHTHHVDVPEQTRPCQALCSALLLIDLRKIRHVPFSDVYDKYFLDLDHSLRVWEAGYRVVCTPRAIVTHLAGATMPHGTAASLRLRNRDQKTFKSEWCDSGRLDALREGIWQREPFVAGLTAIPRRIECVCAVSASMGSPEFEIELQQIVSETEKLPLFRSLLVTSLRHCLEMSRTGGDHGKAGVCERFLRELRDTIVVPSGFSLILVASHLGYNLMEYDDRFYGVPESLGRFGVTQAADLKRPEILSGATIAELQQALSMKGPDTSAPLLLHSVDGRNVVSFEGLTYTIPQELGPVDLTRAEDRSRPGIVVALNQQPLADAIGKAEQPGPLETRAPSADRPPVLVLEGYRGFNIVEHASRYFAILQSDGAFDSRRVSTNDYAVLYVGTTVDAVKRRIEDPDFNNP